jgi:hypothetical protein
MARTYTGTGYFTDRSLTFEPGNPNIGENDNSRITSSNKDARMPTMNIADIHAREVLDSRAAGLSVRHLGRRSSALPPGLEDLARGGAIYRARLRT